MYVPERQFINFLAIDCPGNDRSRRHSAFKDGDSTLFALQKCYKNSLLKYIFLYSLAHGGTHIAKIQQKGKKEVQKKKKYKNTYLF